MKLITKVAVLSVAFAGGIALTKAQVSHQQQQKTAAAMWEQGTDKLASTAQSYILQGQSTDYLATVVANVGGELEREFPIINAVSALLTVQQSEHIKQFSDIRIQDDRTVMTMKASKSDAIDNGIVVDSNARNLHKDGITGAGVTVAVIDSGANMGGKEGDYLIHDSNGDRRVAIKYDAITSQENTIRNDDLHGHGSHISNIIGSSLKNQKGKKVYNGIAPDATLIPVKAFDENGESSYAKILDALNWIYENRQEYKIRVINMSLGTKAQSRYWDDPINQAVMKLWNAGIVVVASAGNSGEDVGITVPGNNPYVITVGASSDKNKGIASFSSRGPTLDGFVKPDVVAPGTGIAVQMDPSLLITSPIPYKKGNNYFVGSGTSQAAAMVTGIAALVIQNYPDISPDDVKCKIMASASKLKASKKEIFSPFEQGAGMVDAREAVESNETGCANKGLDIKADLAGTQRFIGPVVKDEKGEFAIELADGAYLQASHWNNSNFSMHGLDLKANTIDVQASHWFDSQMSNSFEMLASHWSSIQLGVQAAHWASEFNQDSRVMQIMSADINPEPIDLAARVNMHDEKWGDN